MADTTDVDLVSPPVRVLISYAHDNAEHDDNVRKLWVFLRKHGIDAHLDLSAAEQRQDWPLWMLRQIRAARFILMIASPEYRRRAEGTAPVGEGLGVQWEAKLIREEIYGDPEQALNRIFPVVLPGCSSEDIPVWMGPISSTYYTVSRYTVKGAERLLRILTGQPYEVAPILGPMAVLPQRYDTFAPSSIDQKTALLRRITTATIQNNEAMLQADIRLLLVSGGIGISEHDLGASPERQSADRHRIEIAKGRAVIEVHLDLSKRNTLKRTELELDRYLEDRDSHETASCVGILTDGIQWYLYRRIRNSLRLADKLSLEPASPNAHELLSWLEAILCTAYQLHPSPDQVKAKLGAKSPAYSLNFAELESLYLQSCDRPDIKVKRAMWVKLLTTASGSHFTDTDALFVNHTLLVAIAKIIGHAIIGIDLNNSPLTVNDIMSGISFSEVRIFGVIESDFFNWVVDVEGGEQFIERLVRQLMRFKWDRVEHDVLKVLYESIISPETRKLLGEHYTPDWLSEELVITCITDPLSQRALDASCGSGTFLFHAIRHYMNAADADNHPTFTAIDEVVRHVMGIDVHPVAVTLARVTYLMAIGLERLKLRKGSLTIPVYLGDSLRWGQENTLDQYGGLSITTDEKSDGFIDYPEVGSSPSQNLKFPDSVLSDDSHFDELVNELAEAATQRKPRSSVPQLDDLFDRFAIRVDDRPVLKRTFKTMCKLHDSNRDHIWGYYVRNVARPAWLTRPENRVDVLLGNPPWLAYRYMTRTQQVSFRLMSKERGLLGGPSLAPTQDLCALFIVRCIEQYLAPGGRFGYVMPGGVLSLRQYAGLRSGAYSSSAGSLKVQFSEPWDLHQVKPKFFSQHVAVLLGRRAPQGQDSKPLSKIAEVWSGTFETSTASRIEALNKIVRRKGEELPEYVGHNSPYGDHFYEGATLVPHFLIFIKDGVAHPLTPGTNFRAIQSHRSPNEKDPWKRLGPLRGYVEERFIRPAYIGESVLPFSLLPPAEVLIPWEDNHLLQKGDRTFNYYPGLAHWWSQAEEIWSKNGKGRMTLVERIDYQRGISQQLITRGYRVVYNKSGKFLSAAIVTDSSAIIEQQLCWGEARSEDEAHFLVAILNSDFLTLASRPLQPRGENSPRHFGKLIFQLPIPPYDPRDPDHRRLIELARRAAQIAGQVLDPQASYISLRQRVRDILARDGVTGDIDAIVKDILTRPSSRNGRPV